MFSPNFTITNKILKSMGIIEAAKEVIENAPLVPAWEARFREEAMVRTVHHGTHIEGNELSFTEAERLLAGAKIVGRDRDIQEVLNYRNVLKFIECYEKQDVSEETLKHVHELTVHRILPDEAIGVYRKTQVVVKNSKTGEITFRPPPAIEVPYQISDFLEWLNKTSKDDMHPVLKAGITHYELVRIHPFIDGNGRMARAAATLVLFFDDYDIRKFFSLEEYYDREPINYYEALQSVVKEHGNLTNWLGYFTQGLAIELNRIKEKVKALSTDLKIKKSPLYFDDSLSCKRLKEKLTMSSPPFFAAFTLINHSA